MLGLCRLLLRDAVEAEDATQQVFLSAHRSLLGGAVPRDAQAWLAAIARNECRARIRRRMREPLALPELPDDLPDPLATAIRDADLDALWRALSELPRRQRRAFLLREMGGLSYGELGAALGVTRSAVESLLFRARRDLRRALTGTNAALVPVALRDQLAQLIPGFGAAPAVSLPAAAKIAAVTAGVGLGAAGVVALPNHRAHTMRAPEAQHVQRHRSSAIVSAPIRPVPRPAIRAASGSESGQLDRERHEPETERVRVESEQTEDVAGPKQPVEQEGTDAGAADESGSDDG